MNPRDCISTCGLHIIMCITAYMAVEPLLMHLYSHKEGRGMISEQFRFHLYTICMHMTLYYKGKGFSQFIEVMIPELLLLL